MGSSECGDILAVDLATEEGQTAFKEHNMRKEKCAVAVKTACQILEEMMKEA